MGIIVQKYGGSSVATPEQIRQVARRVVRTREAGFDVVVVVSAMGNTTDELLSLARSVSPNPERRELDMLLTVGERISMSLMSMAIHDLGYPAVSFTGSQSGIITTHNHTDARIVRVTPTRIRAALEQGRIVIVAGFQGVSERLEITSLGRGGSDTTAVALAAALGAEYAEICSNVDGVYSADPRVVPAARRLDDLDYDQMQVLADAGAKVLNAEAVEWARRQNIEIRCAQTDGPRRAGTRIHKRGLKMSRVVAVTTHPGLFVLGPDASGVPPPDELEATLVAHGAADAQVWRWPGAWAALVPRQNVHGEAAFVNAINALGSILIRRDLTMVTVVGRSLTTPPGRLIPALAALSAVGITPRGRIFDAGRLAFLVDAARADDAVCALHEALIEKEGVLTRELKVALRLAREAGALALKIYAGDFKVDEKSDGSPITAADRGANDIIVAGLREAFPDDAILSEEAPFDPVAAEGKRLWMVDPLDGTSDFAGRTGDFSIMIGLCRGATPILGVVVAPALDRIWAGGEDLPAFELIGDERRPMVITPPGPTDPTRVLVSRKHRPPQIEQILAKIDRAEALPRGSVGIKCGLVASGEADLYLHPTRGTHLWDCCAPQAILEAAGGRFTQADGVRVPYDPQNTANPGGILAAHPDIHSRVQVILADD